MGWLDEWCTKAVAADPALSERETLVEAIYRERYTEEQLARRIASQGWKTFLRNHADGIAERVNDFETAQCGI